MPLFDDRALGALERGMDGMWLKQQIASHNIANVETPGYKAKKVEFRMFFTRQPREQSVYPNQWWKRTETPRPGRTAIMSRWKRKNWSCGRPIPSIRLSQGVCQASCPRCGM